MAKYCGGINLNLETLKIIKGVICDVNASTVDVVKPSLLVGNFGTEIYLLSLKLVEVRLLLCTTAKVKKLVNLCLQKVTVVLALMAASLS